MPLELSGESQRVTKEEGACDQTNEYELPHLKTTSAAFVFIVSIETAQAVGALVMYFNILKNFLGLHSFYGSIYAHIMNTINRL